MFRIASIVILALLSGSAALADDWDGHYHGHHHHHHHRHHHYRDYDDYPRYREEVVYVPERVVEYVPEAPRYYAPPPPPSYYDQRSPQGLVGGMLGSVMGYQFGGGDPMAAGIGAAAGALLGNGMY